MKQITLVEASAGLHKPGIFTRHSCFEPLALEYLSAVLEREGYKTTILQQRGEPSSEFLKKIFETKPDLVAFSTFTHSFPYSKYLAEMVKRTDNRIYTIFGGVHVSSIPESVGDKSIDFAVLGEGEYTLLDLVKTLENSGNLEDVTGIAYLDNGIKITKQRERITDLDELPFPSRPKKILEKTKIHTLMYPTKSEQRGVASIAYSRGCLFGCSYCASKNVWGRQVRWRSAKNVVDEIESLQEGFETNTLFFTDLTFNLNKERVIELCDEIRRRNIFVNWYAMLRATSPDGSLLVDEELIMKMAEAGCRKVSYGLESFIPKIQEQYNKKGDLSVLRRVLEIGDQIGLINKANLIIGEPRYETIETLEATKTLLIDLPLDELRISFLTPFPNTSIYLECEKEGRITTRDWSSYSSDEPILKLDNLTKEELIKAREAIFSSFYQNPNYLKRVELKVKLFPHLRKSYEEYFDFLKRKGGIRN